MKPRRSSEGRVTHERKRHGGIREGTDMGRKERDRDRQTNEGKSGHRGTSRGFCDKRWADGGKEELRKMTGDDRIGEKRTEEISDSSHQRCGSCSDTFTAS